MRILTNSIGLPMKAEITAGQVSDYIGYDDVMDDDLPPPKVLIADKGYDSDAIREDVEGRGGTPVIPPRRNREVQTQIDGYKPIREQDFLRQAMTADVPACMCRFCR